MKKSIEQDMRGENNNDKDCVTNELKRNLNHAYLKNILSFYLRRIEFPSKPRDERYLNNRTNWHRSRERKTETT